MKDFEKESIEHWEYTSEIIDLVLVLTKYLYVQSMKHGYKHGKDV